VSLEEEGTAGAEETSGLEGTGLEGTGLEATGTSLFTATATGRSVMGVVLVPVVAA
jgi:hypothetical protein